MEPSQGLPSSSVGKESAYNAGDVGTIPGLGRSGGDHDNPPSILAWRMPWTEEPGRLWPMRSQRVDATEVTRHVDNRMA